MTNTETTNTTATVEQINRLVNAGVDIVRVSVPSMDAASAFGVIRMKFQFLLLQIFTLTTKSR